MSAVGFPTSPGDVRHLRDLIKRFMTIVAGVDLRAFPLNIALRTEDDAASLQVRVAFSMRTIDRTNGQRDRFVKDRFLEPADLFMMANDDRFDDAAVDWILSEVREMVIHEVDECFLVYGRRVRDPHEARTEYKLPDRLPPKCPDDWPAGPSVRVIQLDERPSLRGPIDPSGVAARFVDYSRTGEIIGGG